VAADGFTPIGHYEPKHDDSSCGDYAVKLWRTTETVVGVFLDCEGPDSNFGGVIEQASYDQKTGHLTFTARLRISVGNGPAKDILKPTVASP
jgi:hypothetical protein